MFDRNNYLPGETAFLWIDLDNSDCNLDITRVNGAVTQTLILRSRCGREHVVNRNIINETIAGIPARSHAKDENRKTMQLQLINRTGREEDRIPKPSTNGTIVRSTYSLSVTAVLSGCTCCANHPSVHVPITIVAPAPVTYEQVQ